LSKPEFGSWRAIIQGFGSGSGDERAGKSGDKSHAVQTLRVGRAASNFAPAFGLRVLEHRFAPHGIDASLSNSRHSHFGVRAKNLKAQATGFSGAHSTGRPERFNCFCNRKKAQKSQEKASF
jgi:hypothetical protein